MHPFTQNSVEDLRKILIQSGKYSQKDADEIKGKAKLVEAVMSLEKDEENIKDTFEKAVEPCMVETLSSITEHEERPTIPSYNSVDWNKYVLNQFQESELQDGKYPKLDGLRRVAQVLLGDIICSGPKTVFAPVQHDTPGRATCVYEVIFDWKLNNPLGGEKRIFSSVAGAWIGNTDDEYAVFPEAIAETRAEARALRRALRMTAPSAEELTKKDTKQIVKQMSEKSTDGEWQETDAISGTQINFLTKKCENLKIDLMKFINSGKEKYNSINDVPKIVAVQMLKTLNDYQNTTNNSLVIPEEIKL